MFIKSDMNEEIRDRISDLNGLTFGSEEYERAVESINKLVETSLLYDELDNQVNNDKQKRHIENVELRIKQQELKQAKWDNVTKNVLTGIGIAVPAIMFTWATIGSWEFETDHMMTNSPGRKALDKMLSTLKL